MNLRNIFKKEKRSTAPSTLLGTWSTQALFSTSKSMQLAAVYRCVNVLADSLAALPFEPYEIKNGYNEKIKTSLAKILNIAPNSIMSRNTLIRLIVFDLQLKGNAYLEIEKNIYGEPVNIWHISPNDMNYIYSETDRIQSYQVHNRIIEPENIIHIMNFTQNGYIGQSTISYAAESLEHTYNAEKHASGFFKGGANMSGVLTVAGNIKTSTLIDIKNKWREEFNPDTGEPNSVAVLPGDIKYTPVQISSKDAQLLESRKYNVLDICRFFGVPPTKVFDDSQTKYDNVEAANLTFLADSLTPLATKIENEFERKLLIKCLFDTSKFLRADLDTLANYYTKLVQVGAYTPNEVRKELNKTPIVGGDNGYIQVNMQTIKTMA